MSGEDTRAHDLPVPNAASSSSPFSSNGSVPPAPPKRFFLGASTPTRKLVPGPSLIPRPLPTVVPAPPPQQSAPKLQPAPPTAAPLVVTPPKLTRIPAVILTPVDITKFQESKPAASFSTESAAKVLPPPPPLIKMPISTRKEKRGAASMLVKSDGGESDTSEKDRPQEPPKKRTRTAEKSGDGGKESTTPRKIIQEIFGNSSQSKRGKGKGRKKRRGATPKKKILTEEPSSEQKEDEEDTSLELAEIKEEVEDPPEDEMELATVKSEVGEEEDNQFETESVASTSSRRFSRRKAMVVANERLKRLSQNDEGIQKQENTTSAISEDGDAVSVTKENTRAASVQSRRSTTEGSSKSGSSSVAQPDSESSMGLGMGSGLTAKRLRELENDRQRFNRTPITSDEEEDEDGKSHGDDNGSDMQDHKDSDVDSTYSWKPVRTAAALAMEQVTKNQGSNNGSIGQSADAEAKAAAAAERRARKINRYKGRNRRTLMFKSSSSKKYTAVKHSRYTAQPTIAPKVYYNGHYFQAGDIAYVELEDGTPMYGQVRGILMDHYGELSAGLRFLAPKHPIYALMDFEPRNYAFRFDVAEKLVKMEYVNFVMHLNLDHFDGHPSFQKIEKSTVYTRMGKSLHNQSFGDSETEDSESSSDDSSSDSEDENGVKKKKDKKEKLKAQARRRHLSDSSTDAEENNPAKTENTQDKQNLEEVKVEVEDAIENEESEETVPNSTGEPIDVEVN